MSSLRGGFYVSLHRKNGHKKKALFIGDGILSCSNEQVKGIFSGFFFPVKTEEKLFGI